MQHTAIDAGKHLLAHTAASAPSGMYFSAAEQTWEYIIFLLCNNDDGIMISLVFNPSRSYSPLSITHSAWEQTHQLEMLPVLWA